MANLGRAIDSVRDEGGGGRSGRGGGGGSKSSLGWGRRHRIWAGWRLEAYLDRVEAEAVEAEMAVIDLKLIESFYGVEARIDALERYPQRRERRRTVREPGRGQQAAWAKATNVGDGSIHGRS